MTAQVSAQAATPANKPVIRPRAYVPEIEFKGNIDKAKGLIKNCLFNEAADVVRENGFMPDMLIADITRLAPAEVTVSLLSDFSDFLRNALKVENVEKRGTKMSAMLRAAARFQGHLYFAEKVKVLAAIKAIGARTPSIISSSCEEIEKKMKVTFTADDWVNCGFELKSENPGQLVVFHPVLKQSITVYKKVAGPQSEAEKAKAREHHEGERRARQLERASKFPGKVGGGGGGNKSDDGKKGKKK
ncbi:MAG TPA: hypothetical protein VJ579_03840 [Candidatus Paceibacterota bacterium]|nr:hypothetical protein [Candidatus Paceibacterota bacterium]